MQGPEADRVEHRGWRQKVRVRFLLRGLTIQTPTTRGLEENYKILQQCLGQSPGHRVFLGTKEP